MAIASLRSILALKPPFTHSSAAPLPANSPRRMNDLPTIAAVTAPIPIMMGVAMLKSLVVWHSDNDFVNVTWTGVNFPRLSYLNVMLWWSSDILLILDMATYCRDWKQFNGLHWMPAFHSRYCVAQVKTQFIGARLIPFNEYFVWLTSFAAVKGHAPENDPQFAWFLFNTFKWLNGRHNGLSKIRVKKASFNPPFLLSHQLSTQYGYLYYPAEYIRVRTPPVHIRYCLSWAKLNPRDNWRIPEARGRWPHRPGTNVWWKLSPLQTCNSHSHASSPYNVVAQDSHWFEKIKEDSRPTRTWRHFL